MTEERRAPEGGWALEDFPQLSAVLVPYTSNPTAHSDPCMTIDGHGWMFIDLGNIRLAVPDREEWDKLVSMGDRMWNTHADRSHNGAELPEEMSGLSDTAQPVPGQAGPTAPNEGRT